MIYPHQKKAIDYITNKFFENPEILALLVSGSIAHGFSTAESDIDVIIIISDDYYDRRRQEHITTYWESASSFYKNGYFDGKYNTLKYLSIVADRGNEVTRFSLGDAIIAFDKTNCVQDLLLKISKYPMENIQENTVRFISQFHGWKWYCDEAIRKSDDYLLKTSITKLILFGCRLILLDNHIFFPYHKWLLRTLDGILNKPDGIIPLIQSLLDLETSNKINEFYNIICSYRNWTNGEEISWTDYFVRDIELNWMNGNEYIENI